MLGVAPPPMRLRELTADQLAAAIRATENDAMRQEARTLADDVRGEDGVAEAAEYVRSLLTSGNGQV